MKLEELVSQSHNEPPAVGSADPLRQTRAQDLEMILNIVRKINTSLELTEVLELVTDESIRIVNADRGFLMLAGNEGKLDFVVGRNAKGESIHAESFQVSSTVAEDVFTTGESICIEHALTDHRFERRQSIMNLELQTILCSPLKTQDEKIGVLYVDSKNIQAVDKTEILSVFEILVGQAAIAIRNARLYANLKKTFEDLRQAHQHIVQSERMALKGELASEVSHELKNLVSVVLLSLHSLQTRIGTISPEELSAVIDKAIAGVGKIEGFSKNLLTRSHAAVRLVPQSLNKITGDFAEFMKFLPKFKSNRITTAFADDIPPVNLDIDQIQQVLLNLVNNIVEARSDASIHFGTEYNGEKQEVKLKVHDNGPGIDELVGGKLFNERITTKTDGHGYGMLICRQIVEGHGGSIRVESKKDDGATFVLTFPSSS